MEISLLHSHLPSQCFQHKAKDVIAGFTAFRGRGKAFLFSGSCFRSIESGYKWSGLSTNHSAEYSLKASGSYFEKFQPLKYSSKHTRLLTSIREPLRHELDDNEKQVAAAVDLIREVEEVLHMVGGTGEISYAKNSRIQAQGIMKTRPIVEEAVKEAYSNLTPKKFVAVDLACSSGPNTLSVVSEIAGAVDEISGQIGSHLPEIQVFLNDLPGNDFNNIFRLLMTYEKQVREEKGESFVPFYVAGLPGSFYTRLFPSKSVHFFHSSYAQMWLSKAPGVDAGERASLYEKQILLLEQFKDDFSAFLNLRSKELIFGGRMVLVISGRRNDPAESKDMSYIWGLLTVALNDMISEGILEESDRKAVNFPFYTPSIEELESIVEMEGSFQIERVQSFELSWDPYDDGEELSPDYELRGEMVAKYIRAAGEPLLGCHLDKEMIDELFLRHAEIVATHLRDKPTWLSYIIVLKLKA